MSISSSETTPLNLKIIQKLDSTAQSILFTARHERAGVEGTLFIYQKLDGYSFVILNRQKTDNFLQSFGEIENVQLENGFLMFSGCNGVVYGLWFFSSEELQKFCEILETIMKIHCEPINKDPNQSPTDIIHHLNQALKRYDLALLKNETRKPLSIEDLFNLMKSSGSLTRHSSSEDFVMALSKSLKNDGVFMQRLMYQYWSHVDNNSQL